MNHQILRVKESLVCRYRVLGFLAGIILVFSTCKSPDSLFEEFIVPNGVYYPGIAVNPEAHAGDERIKIEWQNGADPKVVKARIFWNNDTVWVEAPINAGMNMVTKIIEPLEENDYSFKIRTYDSEGNVSIPVEVNGVVYGEIYKSNLINRSVKSAYYYELISTLQLVWNEASVTEAGLLLEYKDIEGISRTLEVDRSKTVTTIPNFKYGEPLFLSTMYKPATAFDVFFAPKVNVPYFVKEPEWVNITADAGLKNTQAAFARGALVAINRFYMATDWETNPAGRANGNVDGTSNGQRLTMWTYTGSAPVPSFENGKLYQTVELDAGSYRFEVMYWGIQPIDPVCQVYVAVALGNDLPNIEDIGPESFAVLLPNVKTPDKVDEPFTVDFNLTENSRVTMGFVGNISGNSQFYFSSVKLYGLYLGLIEE